MLQSLLEVLNMSVADSLKVSDLLSNVLPMVASIENQEAPKRLVCMSPCELPFMLAVMDHP